MTTPENFEELMANHVIDSADRRALALIREHIDRTDPVPPGLAERVKFAMTVATLEAEVAHLIHDGELAGSIRTTDYDRASTVTFESDGLSIMLTLEDAERGSTTVRGWVTAPGAQVELCERDRASVTTADDDGRFVFAKVQHGNVHLVIRRQEGPGTRPVITPRIEI